MIWLQTTTFLSVSLSLAGTRSFFAICSVTVAITSFKEMSFLVSLNLFHFLLLVFFNSNLFLIIIYLLLFIISYLSFLSFFFFGHLFFLLSDFPLKVNHFSWLTLPFGLNFNPSFPINHSLCFSIDWFYWYLVSQVNGNLHDNF